MKKKNFSTIQKILFFFLTFVFIFVSGNATYASTIKISKTKATMEVDSTLKLSVSGTKTAATWSTSKKTIATVSQKGVVTAKAEGAATITATVGKSKYKCVVTVVDSNKSKAESTPAPTSKASAKGTRKAPYSAYDNTKLTMTDTDGTRVVKLQLLDVTDGAEANTWVAEENMFNVIPSDNNRWVLYHFSMEYVSGEKELSAADVFSPYYVYDSDSTHSLGDCEIATLSYKWNGYGIYDVKLYEGGKSDVYAALLLDNDVEYITFKVWCGYDSSNNVIEKWFTTKK